jgi:hypothetical protein
LSSKRTKTPRVTKSLSSYTTPKYSYSTKKPVYKEERLVTNNNWSDKGLYRQKSAFKDIKSLRNRTTGFGFNTKNDFSISNVFKGSDVMKSKVNLKRSSYSLMNKRANNYNYKNNYSVNFKAKGFPSYNYSSKLIDTDKFKIKTSLKA